MLKCYSELWYFKCYSELWYNITRVNSTLWTSPDGQYQNQIDYISLQLKMEKLYTVRKRRPGADCGSDHELLIAKFRLKLKKVGKTSRPYRNDLNQTPYDFTVEATNRVKGFDLVDRVPEELWTEVLDIVQEAVTKTTAKKKKCKKAKWSSEEALQIAEKRREVKGKGTRGNTYPTECRVPENSLPK